MQATSSDLLPQPLTYSFDLAVTILSEAEELERRSWKTRKKGTRGGVLGWRALQVLIWFCEEIWRPFGVGVFPSIAFIAEEQCCTRDTVRTAMQRLEMHGFVRKLDRPAPEPPSYGTA